VTITVLATGFETDFFTQEEQKQQQKQQQQSPQNSGGSSGSSRERPKQQRLASDASHTGATSSSSSSSSSSYGWRADAVAVRDAVQYSTSRRTSAHKGTAASSENRAFVGNKAVSKPEMFEDFEKVEKIIDGDSEEYESIVKKLQKSKSKHTQQQQHGILRRMGSWLRNLLW
jgi:hypothetical protein